MPSSRLDAVTELLSEVDGEPELVAIASEHAAVQARLDEAELVERMLLEVRIQPIPPPSGSRWKRQEGRAEQQLFDELWRYALPVMKAFLRKNMMGQLLRGYVGRSYAVSPEDQVVLRNSVEERDTLAVDIIKLAVVEFRKNVLLKRKWSPTGGASLATFFIGNCVLQFPRVYPKWSQQRRERLTTVASALDFDLDRVDVRVADVADHVADRDELRRLVSMATPLTRVILGMILEDKTYAEIAAELRISERAVEGRMAWLRKRARRQLRPARNTGLTGDAA